MKLFPTLKEFIHNMLIIFTLTLILFIGLFVCMIHMPNQSFRQAAPPLNTQEIELLERLKSHVTFLAAQGKTRSFLTEHLVLSKEYIAKQFQTYGYSVLFQNYDIDETSYTNIEVQHLGLHKPEEIIVIGAHYDSFIDSPGADDNASGIAGLLEIARQLQGRVLSRTIRLVAFVNEEAPFFQTEDMGSLVYARRAKEKGEQIIGMMALEMIGYFSEKIGSQQYPPPLSFFYPNQGNFIAFVGHCGSRQWVRKVIDLFRQQATVASEGASLPAFIPGVSLSDHWSFWQQGYPALMITDTAFYRNPYYHTPQDTPDKIDYDRMTRVVIGIQQLIEKLAQEAL